MTRLAAYHVGIVAPRHEDLFTFQDLSFTPPKVLPGENEDEYLTRCQTKLESTLLASITVTLTTDGRTQLVAAFQKGRYAAR